MGSAHYARGDMRKTEFEQILRMLHFADNSKAPARASPTYDKAWKVRNLLTLFKTACLNGWVIERDASLDEMMIRFKGRCGFKQYMPVSRGGGEGSLQLSSIVVDSYCVQGSL